MSHEYGVCPICINGLRTRDGLRTRVKTYNEKVIREFLKEIGLLPVMGDTFKLTEETIQKLIDLEDSK